MTFEKKLAKAHSSRVILISRQFESEFQAGSHPSRFISAGSHLSHNRIRQLAMILGKKLSV